MLEIRLNTAQAEAVFWKSAISITLQMKGLKALKPGKVGSTIGSISWINKLENHLAR